MGELGADGREVGGAGLCRPRRGHGMTLKQPAHNGGGKASAGCYLRGCEAQGAEVRAVW